MVCQNQSSKKLNISEQRESSKQLLGVNLKDSKSQTYLHINIVALFAVTRLWKQPVSNHRGIDKENVFCGNYNGFFFSAIKNKHVISKKIIYNWRYKC